MGWFLVFIVIGARNEVQTSMSTGPFETRALCDAVGQHMRATPGVQNGDKLVFASCWPATSAAAAADAAAGIGKP
ncbi:hypothetical protein [Ancylobacter rudongensis]|uniref:Uncharacterized protein n=1 Tax=Ancylobacter rudongensis TaxID=177413 RepID=A0A1G4UPF3_9HYPH|nr:hypothetical protein [Ancylobacter rudongensis]SCW95447.1 hypothetical protein SAMN05660859_0030 [Ancylobacter rudongensis]